MLTWLKKWWKQTLVAGVVPVLILTLAVSKKEVFTGIDKSDPKWLEDYCRTEVKKLPEPPFKFTGLDGDVHMTLPDVYLDKTIPKDKWFKTKACALWYKFDPKAAYTSVGVQYINHIDAVNTFQENTDTLLTKAMGKSWTKISPLSDNDGGRPNYVYDGFPMLFTRENKNLKTVEYATAKFGANELYIHFIAYEK